MKLDEEVIRRFEVRYRLGKTPWESGVIPESIELFTKRAKQRFAGLHLLDLGCGSGWLSQYFAENGFEVTGIDSARAAIERARGEHIQGVRYRLGDALTWPFRSHSFELVVDRGLFHHLPRYDWKTYVDGLINTIKQDGLFYVAVFSDQSDFPRKTGRSWQRHKDETGYWSYNRYFSLSAIDEIFGRYFRIMYHGSEANPNGASQLIYAVLQNMSA